MGWAKKRASERRLLLNCHFRRWSVSQHRDPPQSPGTPTGPRIRSRSVATAAGSVAVGLFCSSVAAAFAYDLGWSLKPLASEGFAASVAAGDAALAAVEVAAFVQALVAVVVVAAVAPPGIGDPTSIVGPMDRCRPI